jgi:transcriptional regulator GlxA family with amidase domain
MAHVMAVAVTDGIPVFELAVPCEVFGIDRSDIAEPWYDFRLCAAAPGPLRTTAGLSVDAPYPLAALLEADTVLVPACGRPTQVNPPEALLEVLREAHARGIRLVSICTGAYLLAAAGLLDGRAATVHWMNAVDFAFRFPAVRLDPAVLYVDDGDILSSAGTGAAIDLCLHVVRLDHGAAAANEVARRMVVPPHREGGQAQFATPAPARSPSSLHPVLDWARARLDRPLSVADLAREAHMSPRTFARRFSDELGMSPLRWLVRQRVRLAQELLETTDEPVERIARRTGFGTAANLRQHFGRVTSVSPQTYRHVFRRGGSGPEIARAGAVRSRA